MSNINIQGVVDNIRPTHAYLPLLEAVVNALDAIDTLRETVPSHRGQIVIQLVRKPLQRDLSQAVIGVEPISGFMIRDDGIGFDQEHRDSFDTLYSSMKGKQGGKGFGRFLFLKHFENVRIESVFQQGEETFFRRFEFGRKDDIIEHEKLEPIAAKPSGTVLYLEDAIKDSYERRLKTVAKRLLEKLLVFFINDHYLCPLIKLEDPASGEAINLNQLVHDTEASEVSIVKEGSFELGPQRETFQYKMVKNFFPNHQKSKISLVAHHREVSDVALSDYVKEFEGDFSEEVATAGGKTKTKNYIVRIYVLGDYLDQHVSRTRAEFAFGLHPDMTYTVGQKEIEAQAAQLTAEHFAHDVTLRREHKRARVGDYIASKAPWYRAYLQGLDLSQLPGKATEAEMDSFLHRAKYDQERQAKAGMADFIEGKESWEDPATRAAFENISKAKMSDLAHYIFLRKQTLAAFSKALEIQDSGEHAKEQAVHDIIFPMGGDSETTPYQAHNLWIIDEKLNFTDYISSDQALGKGNLRSPDLLIFDHKMAFRGENEASNPVTIFEFKRPQREDFTQRGAKDDPVDQVIFYVNDLREGRYLSSKGRDINISETTPFYGYIVCDVTAKVQKWLLNFKGFTPLPDNQGFFKWEDNLNLYLEVISWDKMLRDANMRNRIFFHKLGLG